MRTRLVTLLAGLGLAASGGAAAAVSAAAAAAAPSAPAGGSFSGGARGAPSFSGGGGASHASFGGSRGGMGAARWAGGGGFGGARYGADGVRAAAMQPGGIAGYRFISAGRGPAIRGEAGPQRLAWAPEAASAARAVRVVQGGLQRRPARGVRGGLRLKPHETLQRPKPPRGPTCLGGGGGGPGMPCPVPGYEQTQAGPQYCIGPIGQYPACPSILMPQSLCLEPDSTGHYRSFDCARPVKTGVRH
jgi:hypothetical protein